jgi:16S rRNA (uracil1498-N3)-methyltransferase
MDRFFAENLTDTTHHIELSQEESHHLVKVLRKRVGDEVELLNGNGLSVKAVVSEIARNSVVCQVLSIQHSPAPLAKIKVALSCIRPNRMDWAVEKLTEIGVAEIIPLLCEFTSVKHFKMQHNQKIAVSALKQSGNPFLPAIQEPVHLSEWLQHCDPDKNTLRVVCHPDENATDLLSFNNSHKTIEEIVIVIGPEGGFSANELNLFANSGFRNVRLANNILRTETAAVVAAAQALLLRR